MQTIEVVEAALIPELLYSVSEQSLKDEDAHKVLDALKRDVERYRGVITNTKQRETFERHLDKTCNEIFLALKDNKRNGWDAVACYSTFAELCSRLAGESKLRVTDDLAFAVRTITQHMADQHGDVWQGMMKAAGKRADKVLRIMQKRGYYV